MLKRQLAVTGLLLTCLLSLGASNAAASFQLNVPNPDVAGTGPYADVSVALSNANKTATITFDSDTNGGYLYLLGAQGAVALNVNGAYTFGSATGTSEFNPGSLSNGGAAQEDGFGNFNLTVDAFDGFTHSFTEVVVTITKATGSWASATDVLTPNANGHLAAAHVLGCQTPCTSTEGAAFTGYASDPATVPEPRTLFSLALGGLAIVGFARRRARNIEQE